MLQISEIIRPICNSSANAILAKSTDNRKWVLRLKKEGKNTRRLVNEYLAAGLGCACGINRPAAKVAFIPGKLIPSTLSNIFLPNDQYGVALEFLSDIKPVIPPMNYSPLREDFPALNKHHLAEHCAIDDNLSQLYGYFVFTNWIQLEDNHKYENLFIDAQRRFQFLDMDAAFAGLSTDIEMYTYDYFRISLLSPFLGGILSDYTLCERWIKRINGISPTVLATLVNDLSGKIDLPANVLKSIDNVIFGNRDQFISALNGACLEWC